MGLTQMGRVLVPIHQETGAVPLPYQVLHFFCCIALP